VARKKSKKSGEPSVPVVDGLDFDGFWHAIYRGVGGKWRVKKIELSEQLHASPIRGGIFQRTKFGRIFLGSVNFWSFVFGPFSAPSTKSAEMFLVEKNRIKTTI